MGKSHVSSGWCAGAAAAPLAGLHSLPTVGVFVGITGAAALVPDLDHEGSTVTRALGPAGWVLCRALRACSHALYVATKGRDDEDCSGTHRHASHTGLFAAAFGALVAFACGFAAALPIPAETVGIAAGLGCFVHCLGDSLTIAGCPWAFPIPIRGEVWFEMRSPFPFRTNAPVERMLVRPVFLLATVLLIPGVLPEVVSLWHQARGTGPVTAVR